MVGKWATGQARERSREREREKHKSVSAREDGAPSHLSSLSIFLSLFFALLSPLLDPSLSRPGKHSSMRGGAQGQFE